MCAKNDTDTYTVDLADRKDVLRDCNSEMTVKQGFGVF